jgi:hypothetical protein
MHFEFIGGSLADRPDFYPYPDPEKSIFLQIFACKFLF